MKVFIKNMVSIRCKMIVRSELQAIGIKYTTVELGEADLEKPLTPSMHE